MILSESVSTLNNQLSSIGGKFDHVSLTVNGVHANVQEIKEHFQKFKRGRIKFYDTNATGVLLI